MTTTSPPAPTPVRRWPAIALFGVVLLAGALAGAYVDWKYWQVVTGTAFLVSIGAVFLLLVAGVIAFLARSRRTVRRGALIVLTASIGVLLGQGVGPGREALLQSTGTITMHLTSPIVATATGTSSCLNVASATEFLVESDESTTRLDTDDPAFVAIYANRGDRWGTSGDPRKDGVLLRITISPTRVTGKGALSMTSMEAGPSSVLVATFTNAGGSISFSKLQPRVATDVTGPPMDLVGTLEWTCGLNF
jgi:hypothetical protein